MNDDLFRERDSVIVARSCVVAVMILEAVEPIVSRRSVSIEEAQYAAGMFRQDSMEVGRTPD